MVDGFPAGHGWFVSWTVVYCGWDYTGVQVMVGGVMLCLVLIMRDIKLDLLFSCCSHSGGGCVHVWRFVGCLLFSGFRYRGLKVRYEIFSAGTDAAYLRLVSLGGLCVWCWNHSAVCYLYVTGVGPCRVYCAVVVCLSEATSLLCQHLHWTSTLHAPASKPSQESRDLLPCPE